MGGVGHIQPEDVHSGDDEFRQHLLGFRGGTKGGDDFGLAVVGKLGRHGLAMKHE